MKLAELTYLIELFGFSPLTVQLELERKLSSQLQSNIKMLQKKLSAKCKDDVQKETLQKCLQELKDVFQNKSKKILEEFNSSVISEMFKIPPHVLFPEDEVHRDLPDDTFSNEDAENKLKETQILIAVAKEELNVLKEIESATQDVSECRHFIESLSANTTDVEKDIQYVK